MVERSAVLTRTTTINFPAEVYDEMCRRCVESGFGKKEMVVLGLKALWAKWDSGESDEKTA